MIGLLIVGGIIALIGWVMLIVAAFRESVWWGLSVLIGPFIIHYAVGGNVWASTIGGLVIILAFAIPRWDDVKTSLIVYVVGCVITVPGFIGVMRDVETAMDEQAVAETEKNPGSPSGVEVSRPYAPPPDPGMAAADPAPPQPVNPPPDTAYDGIQMAPVAQVYVVNSTKKYYPLDCRSRPENAYKMAKSLATRQGYTLAAECGQPRP